MIRIFKRHLSHSAPLLKNYGFIGLGRMGSNMAKNIEAKLQSGDSLHVFDTNEDSVQQFQGNQVIRHVNPVDVARESDIIITMLPEGKHVRQVFDAITDKLKAPDSKVFIDSSTIDVRSSLYVGELVRERQLGIFVDAPVSGGVVGAANGTLTFMVGSKDVTPVTNVLEMMGKRVVPCGEAGSGIAAKLCNNYLLALNNLATAEAFQLANHLGLDLKIFSGIVNTSTGKCWPSDVNNPVPGINLTAPSSNDYTGGFGVSLMNKDFKLAVDAAKQSGCPLPMSEKAAVVYNAVESDQLCKGKDMSVVYKWLETQKDL